MLAVMQSQQTAITMETGVCVGYTQMKDMTFSQYMLWENQGSLKVVVSNINHKSIIIVKEGCIIFYCNTGIID